MSEFNPNDPTAIATAFIEDCEAMGMKVIAPIAIERASIEIPHPPIDVDKAYGSLAKLNI